MSQLSTELKRSLHLPLLPHYCSLPLLCFREPSTSPVLTLPLWPLPWPPASHVDHHLDLLTLAFFSGCSHSLDGANSFASHSQPLTPTIQTNPASLAILPHITHPTHITHRTQTRWPRSIFSLCAMLFPTASNGPRPFCTHTSDTDPRISCFSLPLSPLTKPGSTHLLFAFRVPNTPVFLTRAFSWWTLPPDTCVGGGGVHQCSCAKRPEEVDLLFCWTD